MRELVVKLRFVSPCLGRIKKTHSKHGKAQHYYVLPRDPVTGRIVFQKQWWLATLRQASEILCRHQQEIHRIRFLTDIEGTPQPIPERFYKRHTSPTRYTKHEAFFPGDEIEVMCIVPSTIPDQDFLKLMQYAGKYYGMSPGHPGDYGFYEVVSIKQAILQEEENAGKEEDSGSTF